MLTLMKIKLMTRTHCLSGSIVLPYVEFLYMSPPQKGRKNRDETDTQYLFQGNCKVFRKNTTHFCTECADTDPGRNEI